MQYKNTKPQNIDDLGLNSKESQGRVINPDGSFNVHRKGGAFHLYSYLIELESIPFILLIFLFYFLVNVFFALIYVIVGIENIQGTVHSCFTKDFYQAFFFSSQTLTTLGYGLMAPNSFATSTISAIEALMGLMMFSIVTGLIYGRFTRPKHGIIFSKNVLIAPHGNHKILNFRIANKFNNELLEIEARVLCTLNIHEDGQMKRKYFNLKLTPDKVQFLPLNWTITHEIDEESPFSFYSNEDFKNHKMELLVLIKAYDESYMTNIHAKKSYTFHEVVFDAKFDVPYYFNDEKNRLELDLEKMDAYQKIS